MLKREWGAESNGKLPHLFIPSKTATWVPEFAMEDLPLGRIAALVPEFAVKITDDDHHLMSSSPGSFFAFTIPSRASFSWQSLLSPVAQSISFPLLYQHYSSFSHYS